jgi:Tol biopolymer transport system component
VVALRAIVSGKDRLMRLLLALLRGRVRLVALLAVALFALAALPAGATVSGTNGKIVFGFGDVFTINPDGTQVHQLGVPRSTGCTSWSPDSSKILCNVFSENGPQPATANPDGSDFTYLNTNLPLDLFCLFWSPDGTRLLCHSEGIANPADAGLYTVRSSDAGDLVRVTTTLPFGFDDGYGYSPDGSRILFTQFNSNGNGTLFSVKTDGSNPIQLSPPGVSIIDLPFADAVGADWSPDGSRVTFAASKSGHVSALFVVNADGTDLRQITPSGLGAISAQWSPNGDLIAFTSCASSPRTCFRTQAGQLDLGGSPQAWVVRPDGTGLREVTPLSLTPVWSPDSTKLLLNRFAATGQTSLWTVNSDGSQLAKLTDTERLTIYAWGSAPPD